MESHLEKSLQSVLFVTPVGRLRALRETRLQTGLFVTPDGRFTCLCDMTEADAFIMISDNSALKAVNQVVPVSKTFGITFWLFCGYNRHTISILVNEKIRELEGSELGEVR